MAIALVRRDRSGGFSFVDPTGREHDGIRTIEELLELFDALPDWGETVKIVMDKPKTCPVCGKVIPLRSDGSEKPGVMCSRACGRVRYANPEERGGSAEYATVDRKAGRGAMPSINLD